MRYIDLQVNGAFGIDFNGESLDEPQVHDVCAQLQRLEVEQFLPTLITDSIEKMKARMRRLIDGRQHSELARRMIPGIHLEGPFLSSEPGYIGAHPVQHAKDANLQDMHALLEESQGLVRLVTLAPERDQGGEVTRWLSDQGVRVSAGHTNASLDQLKATIDQGLKGFTHLGNATPAFMPRHDNIIQRALSLRSHLWIMLIADGHHLPPFVLANMLDLLDKDRTILVTDCISAAGLGPGSYQLAGQSVVVGQDGACRSADGTHFVGSAATMPDMDRVLADVLEVESELRVKLMHDNPSRFLFGAV